jgi:hypothetical protein
MNKFMSYFRDFKERENRAFIIINMGIQTNYITEASRVSGCALSLGKTRFGF